MEKVITNTAMQCLNRPIAEAGPIHASSAWNNTLPEEDLGNFRHGRAVV